MVVIFSLMANSTSKKDNFLIFCKRRNRKLHKELLRKLQIQPLVDVLEVVDIMVVGMEERQVEVLVQVLQVLRRNASAPQQFRSTSTHSRRSTITVTLNT